MAKPEIKKPQEKEAAAKDTAAKPAGKADDKATAEVAPKKGKGLIIIIAVVVILLIAGGVVFKFVLKKGPASESKTEAAATTPTAEAHGSTAGKLAIYYKLDPPLVVNIKSSDSKSTYAQAELVFLARDQETINAIKENKPIIMSALKNVITLEQKEKLLGIEEKIRLKKACLNKTNEILKEKGIKEPAEAVLFTSLLLQ